MKRFTWLALFIPASFCILLFVFIIQESNYMREKIDEKYTQSVANNCTDAATMVLLNTANVEADYADWNSITVDPDIAVEEYKLALGFNLGGQSTEETYNFIAQEVIKIIVVAGYDGYFVYQPVATEDGLYEFKGTPKLPYTYASGDNVYALTLNGEKCWVIRKDASANNIQLVYGNSPVSSLIANQIISSRLSEDLNYRIDLLYQQGWSNSVLIPASTTEWNGNNAILGPTVLSLIDNIGGNTSFSIGGTRLQKSRAVVSYVDNGNKYYSYSDLLPSNTYTVVKTYDNIWLAAKEGNQCDLRYMK